MKVVWVVGYKYIDNGVFLDGRSKTLEAHQQGGFHHSTVQTQDGRAQGLSNKRGSEKTAKGCKPMDKYRKK